MKKSLIIVFLLILSAAVFAACGGKEKHSISVEGVRYGLITLSTVEASEGETVTVTCTPDDGYAFKEGSLQANGTPVQGNSFVMPDEDVIVTGEFISTEYLGVYVYSAHGSGDGYIFDFIELGGSTLTAGVTLEEFDYAIYENVPYRVNNFVLTAEVNGEEWTAEIENGVLNKDDREYVLTGDFSQKLNGTFTEIPEYGNEAWDFDYTFENGNFVKTTYFADGSQKEDEATYRLFGEFLIIEEESDYNRENPIIYGVLKEDGDVITFLCNVYYVSTYSGNIISYTNTCSLYLKSEQELALNEGGAYILEERINPYTGASWGEPDCYAFLSMRSGALVLSLHSGDYHYFNSSAEHERHGNILRASFTMVTEGSRYAFHIVDKNTIYVKDSANSVMKFVFTEDVAFQGGYGAAYSNSDSTTYDVTYYEDGKFGNKKFEKLSDNLVETREDGIYHIYGNLLVSVQNGGEIRLGTITEQDETEDCDYIFSYHTVARNGMCEGSSHEPLWKELAGS